MRHLLSHSVYQDLSVFGEDVWSTLSSVGCDGLELLTSYGPVDPVYRGYTETVHLPYAVDWLAAWEGRPYDMDDDTSKFVMYGRDREEVIANVTWAIDCAASVSPAHGVLHCTNADMADIRHHRYARDSRDVLNKFCEMINQVVGQMPGEEPPFKLAFENLWWPGLRLTDESDFRYLESRIDFDNWGICLDTGHLLGCLPGIYNEQDAIEALKDIFHGYSRDLTDRIGAVHFHYSASSEYRDTFPEEDMGEDVKGFYTSAYSHVSNIDQHRPFTDPGCRELLEILQPTYVIHEMSGRYSTPLEEFRGQRALLD